MRTVGLRFFNVYGPRQNPASPYSGVISIFCDRLLRNEPIDVFGEGWQTRDFVFVDDVVAALIAAVEYPHAGASVFNVSTGVATSVLDLARTIATLTGNELAVRYRPARQGEIVHSVGSPGLAQAALDLAPPTALRDGLKATLAWSMSFA
jgi:UDP-glucose 4-epimerase